MSGKSVARKFLLATNGSLTKKSNLAGCNWLAEYTVNFERRIK